MHFDIVEAVRQKQQQQVRSVSIDNGDVVDISTSDGTVVVTLGARVGAGPEEDVGPEESVPSD